MDTDRVIEQRNCALREAHKRIIAASSGINNVSRRTIISLIQEMPAPRFYITPFTAQYTSTITTNAETEVVSKI